MKLLLTAAGETLDSKIDERFGRAEYFIIYDDQNSEFKAIENNGKFENSGAGVKASQFVIDEKVDGLITGALGPKAFMIINDVGIETFKTQDGTVQENIDAFRQGKLELIQKAGDEVKKRGNRT